MSDGLSISKFAGETTTKAIDLVNRFKYNKQQEKIAASNWTPVQQNNLMNALNGTTTDAACGRTN